MMAAYTGSTNRAEDAARLREIMLELARQRGTERTLCPSEVARHCGGDDWRALMPTVHETTRQLWRARQIEVLQRGRPVDPTEARGPVRIRLARLN